MTEKRFTIVHLRDLNICDIQDNAQEIPTFYNDLGHRQSVEPVVELLNEQHERIQELERDIETICNDYEKSHGMDIHNAEWFTAW